MRVYRLVYKGVGVKTFHDVNLSSCRPGDVLGQHPDCRPCSCGRAQFCPDFHFAICKCFFPFGINASGQIGGCVLVLCGVSYSVQDKVAVFYCVAGIERTHVVVPVGASPGDFAPGGGIDYSFFAEGVFPYQFPLIFRGGLAAGQKAA